MKIWHRRAVYISFIAIFLIATPLIILYTMGYRYNFNKARVQKTGIMRITSVPSGAIISLNGVKYENDPTPSRIELLLPGDYDIVMSKGGYHDWKKKLPIYENGTTFAEKVMLWKISSPEIISTTTAGSWVVSPDKNIVAVSDKRGNISLLDINSGLFGEVSGGNIDYISAIPGYDAVRISNFSPSGRYLLVRAEKSGKPSYHLIDTLDKSSKRLPAHEYISIKWEASSDIVYFLDKTGLWSLDPSSLKTASVIKGMAASDFFVDGKTVYSISASSLNSQAVAGGSQTQIEKLDCAGCIIDDVRNGRLLASNGDRLAIVDLNRRIKTIVAEAAGYQWLNSDSLLFFNDYEIYTLNLGQNSPELITRLSSPITSAIWHPTGRYLAFSSEGKVKIIELDNREFRNITDIASAEAGYLSSDRAGNNLYFSAAEGIGKLNIQ